MSKQVFGRQPVAIVAAIQAALVLATSFGWLAPLGLHSADDVMLVAAVLNAVGAVYLALGTTETLLAPVIEFFKAAVGLGVLYGFTLTAEQQALAVTAITAIFALVHQGKTSPTAGLALDSDTTYRLYPPG